MSAFTNRLAAAVVVTVAVIAMTVMPAKSGMVLDPIPALAKTGPSRGRIEHLDLQTSVKPVVTIFGQSKTERRGHG
jgi:hypothetical protein